jgi:hypothetical protein
MNTITWINISAAKQQNFDLKIIDKIMRIIFKK